MALLAGLASSALAAGGCGARDRVDSRLWTLFDIQRALADNRPVAAGPTFGEGLPAADILTPPDGEGKQALVATPCFAEGRPAAFVTTEIWIDAADPWLQPLYIQVVDWEQPPMLLSNADQPVFPLVDVAPGSHFYSPFWDIFYAVVARDASPQTSVRGLLDAGVPLHRAGAIRTCPVRPSNVGPVPFKPDYVVSGPPVPVLDPIPSGQAWFNGGLAGVFDFGPGLVQEEDPQARGVAGIVAPIPMFQFAKADADGKVSLLDAARVGGVGSLFSGAAGVVGTHTPTGAPQPRFGGYWRLHLAMLPATGDAFRAAEHPAAKAAAAAADPPVPIEDYEGRVAIARACFDEPSFPGGCVWLDSQQKIEAILGAGAIRPTEVAMTAPFVLYDKKPVKW